MSGFNLPPGCSASDIPGNRPEDALFERVVAVIMAAQGINEEAKLWYLDELESSFEPAAYENMSDEGIIQDLHSFLAGLDRTA